MIEKISIIVPVYNTEKYLKECLDSLINQTYDNIEIILVDDGSTDKSYDICSMYAEKNNRIKIIRQKNSGQSSARNAGIEKCDGDYILLVDSDDWIDLDMCAKLYKAMKKHGADIVCAKGCFEYENKTIKLLNELKESVLSNKRDFCLNFLNRSNIFSFGTVSKLYKRNIFDAIRYPENMYYEDIYIGMDCLLKAEKIVIGVDSFYHYRQNPNSTIRYFKDRLYYDALKAAKHNIKTIENLYPDLLDLANSHLLLTQLYTLDLMILTSAQNLKLKHILREDLKNNIFVFLRNKYIVFKEKMALIFMLSNDRLYKSIRMLQIKLEKKNI